MLDISLCGTILISKIGIPLDDCKPHFLSFAVLSIRGAFFEINLNPICVKEVQL